MNYRPILNWTHEDVFSIHRDMGIDPNPLYKVGASRVGCLPCIMCRKSEIKIIAERFPDHIDRLREWESIVADASRRGLATFFSEGTAPYPAGYDPSVDGYYGIDEVVMWSKTTRGGRQFDLMNGLDVPQCSSQYGLCS